MKESSAADSSKKVIIVRDIDSEEEKAPYVEIQKRSSSVSIGPPLIKYDGINYEKEENRRNVTPRRYSNCNDKKDLSPCVSSRNNMLLSQVVLDSIKSLPSSDPGSSSESKLISSHASDDDSSQSSLENPLADNESSSENSVSSNSDNAKGGSSGNAYHARLASSARAKSYQNESFHSSSETLPIAKNRYITIQHEDSIDSSFS